MLVFSQTVGFDFVNFDDFDYVYENPHVARGLTPQGIVWALTGTHSDNWHPLTSLSYLLDYEFYGLAPWGYHLTNVLLHGAAAILLFLVLRRMTGDLWPSAFVAAVFAIHPLRAESVAWVSERKDVLSGLLFILTLGAYVEYVRHPFSLLRYLAVVVLFALGLMSKPMLVTLPFVLLLLDHWPLKRLALTWRLVAEKVPLLVLSAASCVVTRLAQSEAVQSIDRLSLTSRIENALVSCVGYVGNFFCPLGLAAFYPHPGDSLPSWEIGGALLLLVAIGVGLLACRRKFPYLPVGWFWYLGMLVPVIGLVQVGQQAMADRYTYLPQIGLAIGLAWGAKQVCERWPSRAWLCGVASALVLATFMGCAWRQTSYWRDSETLWTRALDCTSGNVVAHVNLGVALHDQGRLDEAIDQYHDALAIKPHDVMAHNHLGVALRDQGHAAEAIAEFRHALAIDPNCAAAHNNLGAILAEGGQVNEAIEHYRKAIEVNPSHASAHYNLANALARQSRYEEAMAEFQKSLDINSNSAEAHHNLGLFLAGAGQFDEAIAHFRTALQLKPTLINARRTLAVVLAHHGKIPEAIAEWSELLRLQPDDVPALRELAWLLATSPAASHRNGSRAVQLAERAAELTADRDPAVLDALAAAYAEAGRFSEAVQTARHALELAARQNQQTLAESVRARLSLYEARAPFHEGSRPYTPTSARH